MASENNKRLIQARQQKNLYNPVSNLFKKLTRLFSGPIVMYRQQTQKTLRNKQLNKYASKFYDTSGAAFKKSEYNPFDNLSLSRMVNHQRALRYSEFSQFEFNPDVSSVLDIYAEEMTVYSPLQPIINIKCSNEEIKEVLNNLIYKTLNFEFNAFSWARSLCKYGDFFLYLDIDEEKGIKNVIGLPTEEIERMEGEDKDNPNYIQFQWNTRGLTFENWQIAHFRILGNDKFAPYGSSVLDPARRIGRQLDLLEQAMMAYRIVRSPERKVFYIDVGNIAPTDVEAHMQKIMTQMKRAQVTDADTGNIDLRYNPACMSKYTKVCLLDGRKLTLEELTEKWNNGERNLYTYSLDLKDNGKYVPGEIIWAGKTGEVEKLIKITLDDGGILKVTPEHKMMLRNGNPIEAKDLKSGDSLMPFYTRKEKVHSKQNSFYEQVYVPKYDKFLFTHRIVAAHMNNLEIRRNGYIDTKKGGVVHHKDFNKLNNNPDNLLMMERQEHIDLHSEYGKQIIEKYNNSPLHKEHNKIRSLSMINFWKDEKKRARAKEKMTYSFDEKCMSLVINFIKSLNTFYPMQEFCDLLEKDENFMEYYKEINKNKIKNKLILERHYFRRIIKKFGYKDYRALLTCFNPSILQYEYKNNYLINVYNKRNLKEEVIINHKVLSIEEEIGNVDVYNVTVDKYFNLAVQSENIKDNDNESGKIQLFQSIESDYYIPTRPGSQTKIESLPGGQYTGDIDDVKYLRDKLFAALKVPMSYVSRGDGASDDKQSLASKDVRFARTIQRLQRSLTSELEKIAIIHLYILGFRGEDLLSFNLSLNNPSKITELQELEHWRTKFDVAKAATEGFFSRRWIAEHLFNMSDEEVQRNQREIFYDREMDKSWESIATPEEGEMDGDLSSDLSEPSSDESTSSDETDTNEEDDILLAKPEEGGGTLPPVGEQSMVPIDKTSYISPNAKGKVYTPVKTDKRNMGARKRHMQSMYSHEKSSKARRNLYPGTSNMFGLSNGIMENKDPTNSNYLLEQEEQLLKDNKDIKLLIESLSQRAKKNENDS